MIFRQLFDSVSGTYTYLIASRHGGEALIIEISMIFEARQNVVHLAQAGGPTP